MYRFWLCLLIVALVACGPRQFTKIHFASDKNTNQGRALPVFIIPLDDSFKQFINTSSAVEISTSEELDKMTGVEGLRISGEEYYEIIVERKNGINDFVVVAEFTGVDNPNHEKIPIGDKYYGAKDVYILVDQDRMRIVPKKSFQEEYKKLKAKQTQLEKMKNFSL